MATVSDYFGTKPPARPAGRKTYNGFLIGIEVEIEQVHLKKPVTAWKSTIDNSLKDQGQEFTLAVWHNHAEEYLEHLFSALDKPKASSRCSVHVHANICDFTLQNLHSLILLYIIFERPLFRFSGNRWNNIYCVPVQTWLRDGIIPELMDFAELSNTFPKYSALNILPDDGKLGTVEFRHMAGNRNPMFISTWIDILVRLMKYSKEVNYTDLKASIADMRHTSQYWELFKAIFKDMAPALNYSTFDKDVEIGITFAKLITAD